MMFRRSILRLALVLPVTALSLLYAESAYAVPFTDLGSFAAGEAIPEAVGTLDPSNSDFYLITFSESVLLAGALAADASSDFDLSIYTAAVTGDDASGDDLVFASVASGDENFAGLMLPADVYLFEVTIFDGPTDGYTLSLATYTVPEPASALLVGLGLLCLGMPRQRQR
jgi:hypothetical protein